MCTATAASLHVGDVLAVDGDLHLARPMAAVAGNELGLWTRLRAVLHVDDMRHLGAVHADQEVRG